MAAAPPTQRGHLIEREGNHGRDQVAGQVVIVTGGAGVIGRAICEAFGRTGAFVAVADLVDGPCDAPWPQFGRLVDAHWAFISM